jgi:hypothetical protein
VTRPAERMLALLAGAGVPLPPDPVVRRTYAGRHQRANGAWVWRIESGDSSVAPLIGGWDSVTFLLAQPRLFAEQDCHGEITVVAGEPSRCVAGRQWVLDKPS